MIQKKVFMLRRNQSGIVFLLLLVLVVLAFVMFVIQRSFGASGVEQPAIDVATEELLG